MELNLAEIAEKPDWKEVLHTIVQGEGFDPWDLDISVLVSRYVSVIREMRVLNFRLPANVILVASVLLRYKSDAWSLEPEPEPVPEKPFEMPILGKDYPALEPSLRVTKRKVTLEELIQAIEDIMQREKKKAEKRALELPAELPQQLVSLVTDNENFEERVDAVLEKVRKLVDSQNMVVFSSLVEDRSVLGIMQCLIPLLHLANKGSVALQQDAVFGEIFIHLTEGITA